MAYNFTGITILVVEGSPSMFHLTKDVLRTFGVKEHNIFSAYSVDEGFESFCKNNHDLLVVDWLKQLDNGIELIKRVRNNPLSPNRYVPIIMTAGSGDEKKVLESRNSGTSEYLVKPFSAVSLANRVSRVIENPKEFVVSEYYVGPDRRGKEKSFKGDDQRQPPPRPVI